MKTRIVAFALCAVALAACSHKTPDPQAAVATPRVATPWDDMKKDEQRARDVQKTVDSQAAQQRQQADQAGQ